MKRLLLTLLFFPMIGFGQLSTSFTTIDANCFGAPTGLIDLTVSGGTNPYTFFWIDQNNWNNWTTEDVDSTFAGLHQVLIHDASGNFHYDTITVSQPAPLSITSVSCVNESSFGVSDGSISIILSGGTPPYSYTWSDPSTGGVIQQTFNGYNTDTLHNLTAGAYSVIVMDSNGCVETYNATLFFGQAINPLTSSISVIHSTCCGFCNGEIFLNVTGGTPPYSCSLNGMPSFGFLGPFFGFSGLCAGPNSVTVTDSLGNTQNFSTTVLQPQCLAVIDSVSAPTGSIVNESYAGAYDGHIVSFAFGGIPPYYYTWIGPNGFFSNNAFITNLTAGSYQLSVSDATGCMNTSSYIITSLGCTDPLACNYDPAATMDDSSCIYSAVTPNFTTNMACEGDITVFTNTTNLNSSNVTYHWNIDNFPGQYIGMSNSNSVNPAFIFNSCDMFPVQLSVTDTNGCVDSLMKFVEVYCNPTADFLFQNDSICILDTTCFDANISIVGSAPINLWNWNFGVNVNPQSAFGITDPCCVFLNIGINNIVLDIIDTNGCFDDKIAQILVYECEEPTGILDMANKRNLVKITDMLGQETPYRRNTPLFYIYDDGTVEKKIIIE